ncbi:MAG: hypothetical protein II956_10950 [Bacteroidales bacterium]|nr:hypothetical protein [Bacteroidales bacterium]
MKKLGILTAILMIATGVNAQEEEAEASPLTFSLGVSSNAVWRGGLVCGLNSSGSVDFSAGGFSAGVEAISAVGKDDYTEFDLYAAYSISGAFVSVYDYCWTQDKFEYFGPYKDYHYLELGLGYDFAELTDVPLSVSFNMMLAGANKKINGDQAHSSYIEICYAPSLSNGLDLAFTVGAAIENKDAELMYTKNDGFNFAELKAEISKTYNLKNFCTVTPSAAIIFNPTGTEYHGQSYFVGGVSFGF